MKDTALEIGLEGWVKIGTDEQIGEHSGSMTIKRTVWTLLHGTTQQISVKSQSLGCSPPDFPWTIQHDAGVGFRQIYIQFSSTTHELWLWLLYLSRSVSKWGYYTSKHCHDSKWDAEDKGPMVRFSKYWLPGQVLAMASKWDLRKFRVRAAGWTWAYPAKCSAHCICQLWFGILALHTFGVSRPVSRLSRKHILNHLWRFTSPIIL